MAEVKFQLRADVQQALSALRKVEGQLRDAGDEAQHASGRASKALGRWGNALKGLGIAASAVAVGGIALLGKKAIQLGMDAVESENLFTVSMGKMADAAREWSQTTSKALGLNEFELRKNVGVIFQMTSSMGLGKESAFSMATGISQLANDMASFFNLDPADAFAKLQAGITGEAEPLKRLGILVDETTVKMAAMRAGIIKQGEKMTQTQKVQARWLAITEQTKNAQGDLARTLDSPANKMRILQTRVEELTTKIGIALLPVFEHLLGVAEQMVNVAAGVASGFQDIEGGAKGAEGASRRLADAASMPLQAFLALGSVVNQAIADFLKGVKTVTDSTRSALATISQIPGIDAATFGGIDTAMGKLNAGTAELNAEIARSEKVTKQWDDQLKKLQTSVFGMTKASGDVMNRIITGMDPTKTDPAGAGEATGDKFASGFSKGVKGKLKAAVDAALGSTGDIQGIVAPAIGPLAPTPETGLGLPIFGEQFDKDTSGRKFGERFEQILGKNAGLSGLSSGINDFGVGGPKMDINFETGRVKEAMDPTIAELARMTEAARPATEGLFAWSEGILGATKGLDQFGLNLKGLGGLFQKLMGGLGGGGGGGIFGKILSIGLSFIPGIGGFLSAGLGATGKASAAAAGSGGGGMPGAAHGGIVTEPTIAMTASGTEFMLGEAGPEAIVPLSQLGSSGGGAGNAEMIAEAIAKQFSTVPEGVLVKRGVGAAGGVYSITSDGDKKKFGQSAFQGSVL